MLECFADAEVQQSVPYARFPMSFMTHLSEFPQLWWMSPQICTEKPWVLHRGPLMLGRVKRQVACRREPMCTEALFMACLSKEIWRLASYTLQMLRRGERAEYALLPVLYPKKGNSPESQYKISWWWSTRAFGKSEYFNLLNEDCARTPLSRNLKWTINGRESALLDGAEAYSTMVSMFAEMRSHYFVLPWSIVWKRNQRQVLPDYSAQRLCAPFTGFWRACV